jgi:hypothetical protein
MTGFDELTQLAKEGGRRIFVSQNPIDLRATHGPNRVYVLDLPGDRPGAAGGRIGGIGERRIQKLRCFQLDNGKYAKICEIEDAEKLEGLELPYSATGMGVILPDGTEKVVTGVVDSDLVEQYNAIL